MAGRTTQYQRRARPILPPADRCDLCGKSLYGRDRYHVKLVIRRGPLAGTTLKTLHLCRDCLARIRNDRELTEKFKIRYYKMRKLETRL